jgi:hypothetical protein
VRRSTGPGALLSSPDPLRLIRSRSTPLDDPNPTEPRSEPPPSPGGPRRPPPGLRAQLKSTRDAALALVNAHVDLARAEASAIAGEVGKVAALGALAVVLVIFAVFLLVIGVCLAIGEWLLGSMGWGVIIGVLLFLSIAEAAVLVAVGISGRRVGGAFLVGLVVGVLVAVVFGLNLPNQLYTAIGDSTGLAVETGVRPLVVGVLIWMAIGAVVGLIIAIRMSGAGGGRFVALAGLIVLGAAFGAFSAITFGPQVGAGLGITVGFIAWMAAMGIDVSRTGIDVEDLKRRFTPVQSIDTGKETLEWLQKRMPPGIGS